MSKTVNAQYEALLEKGAAEIRSSPNAETVHQILLRLYTALAEVSSSGTWRAVYVSSWKWETGKKINTKNPIQINSAKSSIYRAMEKVKHQADKEIEAREVADDEKEAEVARALQARAPIGTPTKARRLSIIAEEEREKAKSDEHAKLLKGKLEASRIDSMQYYSQFDSHELGELLEDGHVDDSLKAEVKTLQRAKSKLEREEMRKLVKLQTKQVERRLPDPYNLLSEDLEPSQSVSATDALGGSNKGVAPPLLDNSYHPLPVPVREKGLPAAYKPGGLPKLAKVRAPLRIPESTFHQGEVEQDRYTNTYNRIPTYSQAPKAPSVDRIAEALARF